MPTNLLEENINKLNYTQFIATINQTNVPPGSYSTLSRWRVYSDICHSSRIFEAACTTGFSILNLIDKTGCGGVGVDICNLSVESAKKNSFEMGISDRVIFECTDATKYQTDSKFTHIVLGAALGFFSEPPLMINNLLSMVNDKAYILASPFFCFKDIPKDIVDKTKNVLGIYPTTKSYKEVMRDYYGFNVEFDERIESIPETEQEIRAYCDSTISRACLMLGIKDDSIYKKLYDRLYEIRDISNKLRQYQRYSVMVLRYDKGQYPKRYVEFF